MKPASDGFAGFYAGRRVLVTGDTGFKGSWLTFWLRDLGADVCGYALEPPTEPNLYTALGLGQEVAQHIADVRDLTALEAVFRDFCPEIVLHLAAQPLVRASYVDPVLTYETNVIGTVNVLEAARRSAGSGDRRPLVIVNVSSDKCYENVEAAKAYDEADPLGGFDPYSSSKACGELVTAAYRRSFFGPGSLVRVASARAGNVIGGGDWAPDRIVPDCARALSRRQPVTVRNPGAVRPWQHVLESLSGYLWLAACLWHENGRAVSASAGSALAGSAGGSARLDGAWNFAPPPDSAQTVRSVVELFLRAWGEGDWRLAEGALDDKTHEAGRLLLDASKAHRELGWRSAWTVEQAVRATVDWYRAFYGTSGEIDQGPDDSVAAPHERLAAHTRDDISAYTLAAATQGARWAVPDRARET